MDPFLTVLRILLLASDVHPKLKPMKTRSTKAASDPFLTVLNSALTPAISPKLSTAEFEHKLKLPLLPAVWH